MWSVTVHSVTVVLPDINYGNSLDDSYCTEMQKAALLMYAIFPFKSTNLHITVCGILIERDCFKMFELLRIRSISQFLAAPFSHCKPWLTTLFHLICTSVLGLFFLFLCFASVHFHASLLIFFLSAVDPDLFLDVHPSSEFVTFVLASVYICFPTEGSWNAPLSYFRKLVCHWLIYILFISESQDSLAQFMANLQKV